PGRTRGHPGRRSPRPEQARVRPAPLSGPARRPGGRPAGPAHPCLAAAVWRRGQDGRRARVVAGPAARRDPAGPPLPAHGARGRDQAQPAPMRLRVILLVAATSSLVLVSFLIPLALVLRTLAAARAVSTATAQAQSMAPLVTTLPTESLRLTIDQINAETSTRVTVFLPSGAELGQPTPRSAAVGLAPRGRRFHA